MKEHLLSTFIHKLYFNVIVDPRYSLIVGVCTKRHEWDWNTSSPALEGEITSLNSETEYIFQPCAPMAPLVTNQATFGFK